MNQLAVIRRVTTLLSLVFRQALSLDAAAMLRLHIGGILRETSIHLLRMLEHRIAKRAASLGAGQLDLGHLDSSAAVIETRLSFEIKVTDEHSRDLCGIRMGRRSSAQLDQ